MNKGITMYRYERRLTTLLFLRDIGLTGLEVVQFGEDDVCKGSPFSCVCR